MKKLSITLALVALFSFGLNFQFASAQDTTPPAAGTEVVDAATDSSVISEGATDAAEEKSGHKVLLDKFIEGGAGFMSTVLIALIFGLAFSIERIISLSLASTNATKLLNSVEENLAKGNVEGAKEICKSNRSPIASIMYQGLTRTKDGLDMVEKSVLAYGSVEMGRLERGLTWISLAIGLAPMLGFLGTVIGMIDAFDAIQAAGDISPTVVAAGIKVALLTTVFGLIVAIILQVFYNYIVSRIDSIVNDMEDASISFIDMLKKHKIAE
jgi:biopolymer transport protein ExbB